MSQRDGRVNRQHSLETGLSQAIGPMLICASESSVSVRNQQVRAEIRDLSCEYSNVENICLND